jgi:hypothetical protein
MKKIIFCLLFLGVRLYGFSLEAPDHVFSSAVVSKQLMTDIVLRFYHIQRLHKGVRRLVRMSKKKLVPLTLHCEVKQIKNKKALILQNGESIVFTHPRIIWCLEHIEQYQSLTPFLEVWDDLGHYQLVDDTVVIREFIYLVFHLYKTVVHQELLLKNEIEEVAKLDAIFKKVPSLDEAELEEILNALDLIIDELPVFIEQYELISNLSWEEWRKKYWLLAPIGAAVLMFKFYFKFNSIVHHHKNSPLPESINGQ